MAEQDRVLKDDAFRLEQDLARVIGEPPRVVHRTVLLYTIETGDNFVALMRVLGSLDDTAIAKMDQRCAI